MPDRERLDGTFHYALPMSEHNPEDPHSSCLWQIFPTGEEKQAVAGYILDNRVVMTITQLDNAVQHVLDQIEEQSFKCFFAGGEADIDGNIKLWLAKAERPYTEVMKRLPNTGRVRVFIERIHEVR